MKITVYTITDCEFSKQEKDYLLSHQLQYEEKNLETNKDYLTEMLAVSNNFAGTPVTKIEKDDGKIEILKGFTPEEFNQALGFTEPKKEEPPTEGKQPEKKPEGVKAEPATTPPSIESTQVQPAQAQPTTPPPVQQPPADQPPPANDPLNSILADLQAKSVAQTAGTQPTTANQEPAVNSIPSVPDFPAKT